MKIGPIELKSYNVSIEKSINFKVERRAINNQFIVNYRSLEVKIGENVYKPDSCDKGLNLKLSKVIMDFLRDRENVTHLNLISQVLNKWDYFEIYEEKIENNIRGSADVKLELLGTKDMLLPGEVLKTLHSGLSIDEPLNDEISYYPVWRYEGNRKNSRSKHWIHFDLLVYILSNVFVEFRKEFMSLVTVELQISEVKGESLAQTRSLREAELEIENEKLRGENNDLKSEIRRLNSNLDRAQTALNIAINRIETLNETNTNLTSRVEELNITNTNLSTRVEELNITNTNLTSRVETLNETNTNLTSRIEELNNHLCTFTPSNSSTNSIRFHLRLYTSNHHPKNPSIRAKATTGKIWIGIYCGELANYSKTIRDPRARVLVTYPINSRDSLTYINDIIGDDFIQESNYKHWLVNTRDLGNLIDEIAQVLIDNEAIVGQIDFNRDVLNEIINVEPEDIIQEIEPDPVEPEFHHIINNQLYDFTEISRFEYYYRKYYRRINENVEDHRLYFLIGNARNRVREYILYEDLERLTRRRID